MAYAVGLRATSFAASAGLLALAALAALTMTFTAVTRDPFPSGEPPVVEVRDFPPPPVETPTPRATPQAPAEESEFADAEPLATSDEPEGQLSEVEFTGPTGPVTITDARWARQPRDLERFYPRRAREHGVEGVAVLDCFVAINGAMTCQVISESPENWGFGTAALRISREHQMLPAMRNGVAVEGRYRMRVPFELH